MNVETPVSFDDSLSVLEQAENNLKQVCLENNIDYDDEQYLAECSYQLEQNLQVFSEIEQPKSKTAWSDLSRFIKNIISGIVYGFKQAIESFKLTVLKAKNFFKSVIYTDNFANPVNVKSISIENGKAKVKTIKAKNYREIEKISAASYKTIADSMAARQKEELDTYSKYDRYSSEMASKETHNETAVITSEDIAEELLENMSAIPVVEAKVFSEEFAEDGYELIQKYKNNDEVVDEATLTTKERNELPASVFGIPSMRKYPLNDADHVKSAIKLFGHCPEDHEKELAGNIKSAMRKYDIPFDSVGKDNKLYKYIHEDYTSSEKFVNEAVYEAPYNRKEIERIYGKETLDRLMSDPIHAWRADNGIELIHKEPSLKELERIWKNWNLMSHSQKKTSDDACKKFFGKTNKELYEELRLLYEAKEFPVQFTDDGDLLIKNYKKMDYNQEYQKSHDMIKTYDKSDSIEGVKYELARLWFINTILTAMIYDNPKISDEERKDYMKIRSWVMNDFVTYNKKIAKKEPKFNFSEYYNTTPFSDVYIKINASTMKFMTNLLKDVLKIVVK